MAIYTKTGDRGKTSLRSGSRVWKDSLRVETYGTIDELNSYLGVIVAEIGQSKNGWRKQLRDILHTIQNDLLYIGSVLSQSELVLDQLAEHISRFEQDIDTMTDKMPELSNFILPGGGKVGSQLQYARTLARRAERRVVTLARKEEALPAGRQVDQTLIKYVNRLSDLFFTMGRFASFNEKHNEVVWKPFK